MVRRAGRHDQARALQLIRDVVNVGRPSDKRIEGRILQEDFRCGRRIRGPFEIDIARIDSCIDEQRHDKIMAGRILG